MLHNRIGKHNSLNPGNSGTLTEGTIIQPEFETKPLFYAPAGYLCSYVWSHTGVMDYDEASCILLLEWSTTFQRLWMYKISVPYARKKTQSSLKRAGGNPVNSGLLSQQ